MRFTKKFRKTLTIIMAVALVATSVTVFSLPEADAASFEPVTTATAKVKVSGGAYMRKSASTLSGKVALLKKNTVVTVQKEVFLTKSSTSAKKRWYYVTCGTKKGYIRADLLGSFTYKGIKGKTTCALNYRTGAGTSMTKKGTLKKGTSVTAVLAGNPKGSSAVWYKISKGSKYYYVSGQYVKFDEAVKTASTASSKTSSTSTAAASASAVKTDSKTTESSSTTSSTNSSTSSKTTESSATTADTSAKAEEPVFELVDVSYPESEGESLPFYLKGKINCNVKMTKAVFGIMNKSGKWVQTVTKTVDDTTFNITSVDASLKFGTLAAGKYTYRGDIYIGDKCYTQISKAFEIRKLEWPDKIAETAIALAWPLGTATSKYKYSGGAPTAKFKTALNEVYPDRSSWGAAPKVGASCDVFVGTSVRYSGYDKDMPRGLGNMTSGQWAHLDKSDLWQQISYNYDESVLRNGDIIIYQRYSGSEHICIYVKINGKGYLAEAAIKNYYGHIGTITSGSKIFKKSDKKMFKVYRARY